MANLFNTLTGYGHPEPQRKMLVAPDWLRQPLIDEIERTVEAHREGKPARIVMKMNSLVDQKIIEALYRASQAGVPIDLNVRGICCLLPGHPRRQRDDQRGVGRRPLPRALAGSTPSTAASEHVYYIGSADLMPRNLDTRVELLVPIERPELQAELDDTLERCLADDTYAWTLGPDGPWTRRQGGTAQRAQRADGATLAHAAASAGQLDRVSGSAGAQRPLLVIVVVAALAFDFTNGFHDTANVVASSISTRALAPRTAIALASVLNFAGAFISLKVAATVATGIIDAGQVTETIAFAGLVGAIAWNLLTWTYGLPSSSSHALIGGVIGAMLAAVGGAASRAGG